MRFDDERNYGVFSEIIKFKEVRFEIEHNIMSK